MKNIALTASLIVAASIGVAACARDADVVSHNLSYSADMFEVNRRVVFYNGITDSYMLTIEGLCSLGNNDPRGQLTVTCKVGPNQYRKHFLGLSDNVTYFVEHIEPSSTSPFQYKVSFKPSVIIPDIDLN